MIGERYAAAPRSAAQPDIRRRARRAGKPAIAGRLRIAEALGQSLVVQLMLVMSLLVFAALIYLNQASKVSILQYNLTYLRQDGAALRMQNAKLHEQSTRLTAPSRIEGAATQLHMSKPSISNSVWIDVTIPRVQAVKPITADVAAAQEKSSPRAWIVRFATFIKSSL